MDMSSSPCIYENISPTPNATLIQQIFQYCKSTGHRVEVQT